MNDDRVLVDIMGDAIAAAIGAHPNRHYAAAKALAALRAEGFDLYRPEDCEKVHKFPTGFAYHEPSVPLGTYRLVPVGGEG